MKVVCEVGVVGAHDGYLRFGGPILSAEAKHVGSSDVNKIRVEGSELVPHVGGEAEANTVVGPAGRRK
jgi:hypothetical protein